MGECGSSSCVIGVQVGHECARPLRPQDRVVTNVPEVEAELLSVEEGTDVSSPKALRMQGVA